MDWQISRIAALVAFCEGDFAEPSEVSEDKRINSALKIACADEFIKELENGTDTLLGERSTGLSEGQMRQGAGIHGERCSGEEIRVATLLFFDV